MTREASFDQLMAINNLHEGDKILLTNGQVAEFVRAKQKKFVGIIEGVRYDIPMVMYKETVGKIDINQKKEEKEKNNSKILNSLKTGDWFYINKNGNALVFKFQEVKGNKIIGINPINNTTTKIDINFEIGIVK